MSVRIVCLVANLVEISGERVAEGHEHSNNLSTALAGIATEVGETAEGMRYITDSTQRQAAVATEVDQVMERVGTVIEGNTSAAEQMASSAQEMAKQAQKLQVLVDHFIIDADHGDDGIWDEAEPIAALGYDR